MIHKKYSKEPTAKDFTAGVVQKHIALEALQHPSTLFCGALALLSTMYLGLIDFNEFAFTLGISGGLGALTSWIVHYFIRGEKLAQSYLRKLHEQRDSSKQKRGIEIIERCQRAEFKEGEQAAQELIEAFKRLADFLKKHRAKQSLTVQRFLVLAEETLNQGLQFLDKAVQLAQALKVINIKKLKNELKIWEKELSALQIDSSKNDEAKKMVIQATEAKIRSHKQRLKLYTEREKSLKQLLAECEVLEATLDSAYLESVDMIENKSTLGRTNVASDLERAVKAARKVEERLRNLGHKQNIQDAQYDIKN